MTIAVVVVYVNDVVVDFGAVVVSNSIDVMRVGAPFPSFGLGNPLHPVQLPTPSGNCPHPRGITAQCPGAGRPRLHRIPLRARACQYLFYLKYKLFVTKRLINSLVISFSMEVLTFKGRIQAERRRGKTYVRIYVYMAYGGDKLVKYIGKEVEGMLVVRNESPQSTTH
jgi:hypothetical protein